MKTIIDEEELNLFLEEIAKNATKKGVSFDLITTILAEAIKTREDELAKQQLKSAQRQATRELIQSEQVEQSVIKVVEEQQPVYGPPPRQEVIEMLEPQQPVYGPPPRREVIEVFSPHQPVYGPPPRKRL